MRPARSVQKGLDVCPLGIDLSGGFFADARLARANIERPIGPTGVRCFDKTQVLPGLYELTGFVLMRQQSIS